MSKPSMEEQLKSGKILPLLLKLAIPGTIAQIVNALYSMVDRIFIGRMEGVGLTALAGLGLTMPIIQIISAFSYLIGRGGAPLLSIKLGGKRPRNSREAPGTFSESPADPGRCSDCGILCVL